MICKHGWLFVGYFYTKFSVNLFNCFIRRAQQSALIGGSLDIQNPGINFPTIASSSAATSFSPIGVYEVPTALPGSTQVTQTLYPTTDSNTVSSKLQQALAAIAANNGASGNSASPQNPVTILNIEGNASATPSIFAITPTSVANSQTQLSPNQAEQFLNALQMLALNQTAVGNTVTPGGYINNPINVASSVAPTANLTNAKELLNQLYNIKTDEASLPEKVSEPSKATLISKPAISTALVEVPQFPQTSQAPPKSGTPVPTSTTATSTTYSTRGIRNSDGNAEPCLVCGDVASGGLNFVYQYLHCFEFRSFGARIRVLCDKVKGFPAPLLECIRSDGALLSVYCHMDLKSNIFAFASC